MSVQNQLNEKLKQYRIVAASLRKATERATAEKSKVEMKWAPLLQEASQKESQLYDDLSQFCSDHELELGLSDSKMETAWGDVGFFKGKIRLSCDDWGAALDQLSKHRPEYVTVEKSTNLNKAALLSYMNSLDEEGKNKFNKDFGLRLEKPDLFFVSVAE